MRDRKPVLAKPTKKTRRPAKKAGNKRAGKVPAVKVHGKASVKGAMAADAQLASPKKRRKAPVPKVEARPSVKKPFWKRWIGWLVKRLLVVVFILSLIPVLLTAVYWPSFVHPISSLMVSKWVSGETVKREWVKFEDISPTVWQSVMMSEDGQFCSHSGVDWNQINIVVGNALDGGRMRGASTISMQSVKNLYCGVTVPICARFWKCHWPCWLMRYGAKNG